MPPPLPPIHTLPLLSTEMPWFDDGHTYDLSRGARPHYARLRRHRSDSFEVELLHALALVRFARVQVAVRVGGDAVHAIELSGLPPAVAVASEDVERGAVEHPDLHVHPVG